jgi:hypothetical protein
LTLCSRCGLPSGPRKYFDTTTLVAIIDQALGISTPALLENDLALFG